MGIIGFLSFSFFPLSHSNHTLARHSDILTSIETRISMLTMTYSKFIDLNICCFIPGRVLDEINSILKLLATTTKPLRPHEVLQELRDISSMAIEHFDEKIAVHFKAAIKLTESSTSNRAQVVVCSSLGDISFNGVKVSPMRTQKAQVASPQQQQQHLHNMLCINPKADSMMQQALLLTKSLPASAAGIEDVSNPCGCDRDVLVKQLQRQWHVQKSLTTRIRYLEGSRRSQGRRLQEALGSITELSTQVSEIKRQLEDVLAKAKSIEPASPSSPSATVSAVSVAVKRASGDTLSPPSKKPKAT